MHEEKIWALDFAEDFQTGQIMMLTGGSDSKVKLWQDSTVEEEIRIKDEKMTQMADEQKLSKLMRDNDLV